MVDLPPELVRFALVGIAALAVPVAAWIVARTARNWALRQPALRSDDLGLAPLMGTAVGALVLGLGASAGAAWAGWTGAAETSAALALLSGRVVVGLLILGVSRRVAAELPQKQQAHVAIGGAALAGLVALTDAGAIVLLAVVIAAAVLWVSPESRTRAADALADLAAGIRLRTERPKALQLGDRILDIDQIGLLTTRYRSDGETHSLRNEAVLALRADEAVPAPPQS